MYLRLYLVDLSLQLRNNVLQSVPVLFEALFLALSGVQLTLHLSDCTVDCLFHLQPVLLELFLHLIPHLLHQDRDVQSILILVHLSQLRVQHFDDTVRMLQPIVQVTNLLKEINQALVDNNKSEMMVQALPANALSVGGKQGKHLLEIMSRIFYYKKIAALKSTPFS